jgi:hypothetical protein
MFEGSKSMVNDTWFCFEGLLLEILGQFIPLSTIVYSDY